MKFKDHLQVDLQEIAAILLASTVLTLTLVIPMQSLHKLVKFSFKFENSLQNGSKTEKNETISKELYSKSKEEREIKQKPRAHFLAHREVLEEIPEEEVEYEINRHKNEGLDEILEEEENEGLGEVDQHHFDDELDVIEEEQGGEEAWVEREYDERPNSREDNDLDEWEWTANNEDGAQYFRNIR